MLSTETYLWRVFTGTTSTCADHRIVVAPTHDAAITAMAEATGLYPERLRAEAVVFHATAAGGHVESTEYPR